MFTPRDITIAPNIPTVIYTDIALSAPRGSYARIALRHEFNLRYGTTILARIIDANSHGSIAVTLQYNSNEDKYQQK